MIEEWPEELKECTPNPHQDYLFEVRTDDDPKKETLNYYKHKFLDFNIQFGNLWM